MTDNEQERILTLDELGRFLRLSLRTVYQMATEGKIPGRKIGKQWRFDRETILAWLNSTSPDNDVDEKSEWNKPELKTHAHRILVVEDDRSISDFCVDALTTTFPQMHIRTASDGLGALVEIGRFAPHIVISDITIPRVDGLEICRILKHDPDLSTIGFIAISGTPDKSLRNEVMQAGADAYIRKPFIEKDLIEQVRLLMSVHEVVSSTHSNK